VQKENELGMRSVLEVGQNGPYQERALVRSIYDALLLTYSKPIYGKHNTNNPPILLVLNTVILRS